MKSLLSILFSVSILLLIAMVSCKLDDLPVEKQLSFEEQLEQDISYIDDYLDDHDIVAIEHQSGIRYVITQEGDGEHPSLSDFVKVIYEGRYFNQSEFAPEVEENLELDILIEAWQIVVPLMKVGEKVTIYAPSGYCYGAGGTLGIAPNTNLIFDIELLEILEQ